MCVSHCVVRPLSVPSKLKKSKLKPGVQPKLFEGSLEEYIKVRHRVCLSIL